MSHIFLKCELVIQRKEEHIISYHVPKISKFGKIFFYFYSKYQVSKQTKTENLICLGFLRQTDLWEPNCQINYQVFFRLRIL